MGKKAVDWDVNTALTVNTAEPQCFPASNQSCINCADHLELESELPEQQ